MKLKLALLQLLPGKSVDRNLRKGEEACRTAKALGADIALFPEMWSCGYEIPEDLSALKELAVGSDGGFVGHFRNLAKELGIAVAITYLERHEPSPRNALTLFDRMGRLVYSYSKVHTCDFGEEARLQRTLVGV